MPRQTNGAQNHSGQADEASIAAMARCPAACWLFHEGSIERGATGWPLRTECGACGLVVTRREWGALNRQPLELEAA